jgi:transposase InsO family protein
LASHQRNRKTYSPERPRNDLTDYGVFVDVHRIKRIWTDHGIRCKQRKRCKVTANSRHDLPVAANHLNQKFVATAPNQVCVTDITIFRPAKDSFPSWRMRIILTANRGLRHKRENDEKISESIPVPDGYHQATRTWASSAFRQWQPILFRWVPWGCS